MRDFFLFVGVLRYYKGLHILLDAIEDAPYKVVIVGSGPVEAELREQALRLGLDNVIFAGFVSDREKNGFIPAVQGRGVPLLPALGGIRGDLAGGRYECQAADFR